MVAPDQIAAWKAQYGKIYQVDEFIFRVLTLGEYQRIFASESTVDIEESVFRTAVLNYTETQLDELPAGSVSAVAEQVIIKSGFADTRAAKQILDARRAESQSVFTLAKAMVLATMPAYTEEHLNEFTFAQLLTKVALAEEIIKVKQAILKADSSVELALIDPEEEAERQRRAAVKHNAQRKEGQAIYGDPVAERLKQALQ